MELFLSVEQNHTLKMRNYLSPFISEVPTAAQLSVQVPAPGEGEKHSILESFFQVKWHVSSIVHHYD